MPFMTSFNVYAGGVLVEEISFNGEGRLTKLKDEITLIASNSMGNSVGSITLKYQGKRPWYKKYQVPLYSFIFHLK